jgi:hypothetical protein
MTARIVIDGRESGVVTKVEPCSVDRARLDQPYYVGEPREFPDGHAEIEVGIQPQFPEGDTRFSDWLRANVARETARRLRLSDLDLPRDLVEEIIDKAGCDPILIGMRDATPWYRRLARWVQMRFAGVKVTEVSVRFVAPKPKW